MSGGEASSEESRASKWKTVGRNRAGADRALAGGVVEVGAIGAALVVDCVVANAVSLERKGEEAIPESAATKAFVLWQQPGFTWARTWRSHCCYAPVRSIYAPPTLTVHRPTHRHVTRATAMARGRQVSLAVAWRACVAAHWRTRWHAACQQRTWYAACQQRYPCQPTCPSDTCTLQCGQPPDEPHCTGSSVYSAMSKSSARQ